MEWIPIFLKNKFFTYRQQEGQNFHDFVTELKKLSSKYEFDNLQDSQIKHMVLCGSKDPSWKASSRMQPPLSKAIGAGQAAEETCQHAFQILRFQPTSDMDKIIKKETE